MKKILVCQHVPYEILGTLNPLFKTQGFRIRYEGDKRTVVDGPFAESKELIAGFTIIDVASRAQAVEWACRFPNPHPGTVNEIEVRPYYELEDFEPGAGIDRFRELEAARHR